MASGVISFKQQSFLKSLLSSKVVPEPFQELQIDCLSAQEASELIKIMIEQPKLPLSDNNGNNITTKAKPAEAGFYFYEGSVFNVVSGKTGNRYAKVLVEEGKKGRWEYIKGMVNTLNVSHLISLSEAKKFGHEHGFCVVCGRTLTDPISVQNGIGPICSGRF